jgi:hypothetical protein
MPTFFQSWTNCSQPSQWYAQPILTSVAITIIAALLGGALINVGGSAWTIVSAALLGACIGGIYWCSWWLNIRLVCLGGDKSAIGVIASADQESATLSAFDLGHYDTDYTFNLLLWPFAPALKAPRIDASAVTLPGTFVGQNPPNPPGPLTPSPPPPSPPTAADSPNQFNGHEWDPVTQGNLFGNAAFWLSAVPQALIDAFGQPVADVKNQVQLILPQNSMVSLQRPFTGQPSDNNGNTGGRRDPKMLNQWGSDQQFLLHCEIEGSGIYALRTYLYGLAVAFGVATALSTIPGIGTALSWLIDLIALIVSLFAGPAIQANNGANPPADGGFGGSLNVFNQNGAPNAPVDVAYCYGRWVFDSFHSGWNELHPLHFMIKIAGSSPTTAAAAPPMMTNQSVSQGNWPPNLGQIKDQYDQQFGFIYSAPATELRREPQNQWKLHPLLDGCRAATPYASPPPPSVPQ